MAENRRNNPDYSDEAFAPSSKTSGDPLAELARLIGQSDPFADGARAGARKPLDSFRADDRPAPEWLARPAAAVEDNEYDSRPAPRDAYAAGGYADQHESTAPYQAHEDYRPHGAADSSAAGGFLAEDRYQREQDHAGQNYAGEDYADKESDANGAAADDAYGEHDGAHAQDSRGDDRYRVSPPPPGDYEDSYYADDGHMPPNGEEGFKPNRRRGGLAMTIAAVVGLAVIGTAGAFGYRAFTSGAGTPADPPVIKADTTPAKIVPATTAPTADAQGKPFQERVGNAIPPERVVPREEQPVSLAVTPPRAAAPQNAFASTSAAPLVAPSGPSASVNEPKRVRTMTIRPDAPGGETIAAPPPTTGSAARAPAAKQSAPLTIAPQSDPSPRTKVATRTPVAQASGAYVVQVSAQKTEEEAQSSYRALQAKYPGVLSGRDASIRRADLGDKGVYYRAQVGPFANAEAANTFCGNLKAAGGQCIVQKN
jgi:hypothetical protein